MLLFLQSVVVYFILLSLVLACTANLVPRAVDLGEYYSKWVPPGPRRDKEMQYVIALDVALV